MMPADDDSHSETETVASRRKAYWRANVRLMVVLLVIWFVVSFLGGLLFADYLDRFMIPGTGFPLGFWFGHQGAMVVFVVLIWVYAWRMNRLDRRYGVDEE